MSRRPLFLLAFLLLSFHFCIPSVYSWPFGDKKEETPKVVTPKAVPAAKKTETPRVPENKAVPAISELPQLPKVATVSPAAVPSVSVTPPVPVVVSRDVEITRIKTQIQDIIKINEGLKANYADQAAEIQKISEQARIHQRILKDLETAKVQQKAVQTTPQNFLDNEKIKLIQKETEKNQKYLETLKTSDVSKKVQPIPMQEQDAGKS